MTTAEDIYKILGTILFNDSTKIHEVHDALFNRDKTRQIDNQRKQTNNTNKDSEKTENSKDPSDENVYKDEVKKEKII